MKRIVLPFAASTTFLTFEAIIVRRASTPR
jgi:hypothetical protein